LKVIELESNQRKLVVNIVIIGCQVL